MANKKNYRRKGSKPAAKKAPRKASVAALSKQVTNLKKQITKDMEMKKYSPTNAYGAVIGQVNVNNTGADFHDLTVCNIGQGLDDDARVGKEITLKGIHFRIQMIQSSANTINNRYVIDVWRTTDMTTAVSTIRNILYDADSISGVIDANSTVNKEFMSGGAYTRLFSKSYYHKSDSTSGETSFRDLKFFIKQNQKLVYTSASQQVPQNHRYLFCVRCQAGNASSTTASTLSTIPVTAINTGVILRMQHTEYFYDS